MVAVAGSVADGSSIAATYLDADDGQGGTNGTRTAIAGSDCLTPQISAIQTTGVTDVRGQVFGTDNVFIAGASVFPAGGFASPTLTSIARSLRLARWLKGGTA